MLDFSNTTRRMFSLKDYDYGLLVRIVWVSGRGSSPDLGGRRLTRQESQIG